MSTKKIQPVVAIVLMFIVTILICAIVFSMDHEVKSISAALRIKHTPAYFIYGTPVSLCLILLYWQLSKGAWKSFLALGVIEGFIMGACIFLISQPQYPPGVGPAAWSFLLVSAIISTILMTSVYFSTKLSLMISKMLPE